MINTGNSNMEFKTLVVPGAVVAASTSPMVPSDKLNATYASQQIPQARFYTKNLSFLHSTYTQQPPQSVVDALKTLKKERVRVQLLQTHSKLQNNRWDYQNFYRFTNNTATSTTAVTAATIPNQIIMPKTNSNKSAFFEGKPESNNNNNSLLKTTTVQQLAKIQNTLIYDRPLQHRTEDQENAFRRIEDVHNYAKLNYSNCSNCSSESFGDDPDEDYDEEQDDDEGEGKGDEDGEDTINKSAAAADGEAEYGDLNYEDFVKHNSPPSRRPLTLSYGRKKLTNHMHVKKTAENVDAEMHVDVETIQNDDEQGEEVAHSVPNKLKAAPEHHARRPMNAFLIFCKRHRAIVKDRYKSLENRAITKILGDWWASLDVNDKKCFTNLAQQNKDAFFSANPNFKWYKLPAPPLRTLNTRPTNNERSFEDDMNINDEVESEEVEEIPNIVASVEENYFKLADEAQMGDLSSLMSNNNNNNNNSVLENSRKRPNQSAVVSSEESPSCKRLLYNDNSLSSTSSSEDSEMMGRKNGRSCKGKIYKELMSSGQIAVMPKKTKNAKNESSNRSLLLNKANDLHHSNQKEVMVTGASYQPFDLEEKIKELPALNLDAYLTSKRVGKKKKKFNHKKRALSDKSKTAGNGLGKLDAKNGGLTSVAIKQAFKPPAAVGSQKRKARKESITRRDISSITEEVASIIPMSKAGFNTINGCYILNDAPMSMAAPVNFIPNASSNLLTTYNDNINNSTLCSSSSTSDLLILAEVAANRTELSN